MERPTPTGGGAGDGLRRGLLLGGAGAGAVAVVAALVFVFLGAGGDESVPIPAQCQPPPVDGGQPAGAAPAPGGVSNLTPRWRFETDGKARSAPAVGNGTVYVATDEGSVHAVSEGSGEERWRFDAGAPVVSSPVAHRAGLYVSSVDGTVHAVDPSSGSRLWSFKTPGLCASPLVANATVYVADLRGNVHALDQASGRPRWRFQTAGVTASPPRGVVAAPVTDGTSIYVASTDRVVYAVSAAGAGLWRHTTGGEVRSSPSLVGGAVFITSQDGYLYGVDARTGTLAVTQPIGERASGSPAVAGSTAYIGTTSGSLLAHDVAAAKPRWQRKLPGVVSPVIVLDCVVYAASTGPDVYAFDAGPGTERWRYRAAGGAPGGVTVSGGSAYFATGDGYVHKVSDTTPAPAQPC